MRSGDCFPSFLSFIHEACQFSRKKVNKKIGENENDQDVNFVFVFAPMARMGKQ